MSALAVETHALGKRFGSTWALQDCTLAVPPGRVTALVGANGAGKTTLLRLLVGLVRPSAGSASVLGETPGGSEEILSRIGYLAQDVPLYRRLSANDHIALGARVNHHWDNHGAGQRLAALGVPADRPVQTLSGGQRAQVGLGLALAKHPEILLLDEPVASLDPLARREFLSTLSEAVAENGMSVIVSSHLLHDLERVCDHLIFLSASRTVLCEDIDPHAAGRQSVNVAERMIDAVGEPFVLDGDEQFLSASVGIALALDGSERPEDLLRDADGAMYRAKRNGRARVEVVDDRRPAHVS